MSSGKKLRAILVTVIVLQVLALAAKLEDWSIIRKIDRTTQSNVQMLAVHEVAIRGHDLQFEAILEGTFSKEFAGKIRRNLNAQR